MDPGATTNRISPNRQPIAVTSVAIGISFLTGEQNPVWPVQIIYCDRRGDGPAATGAPPTSGTSMHGPSGVAGGAWVTVGAAGREGRRVAAISAPMRATAPRMG